MSQRTVSVEDIAKAIELGGYPVARRYFFRSHLESGVLNKSDAELAAMPSGELVEACALGIAALNLGVGPYSLFYALDNVNPMLTFSVFSMNDKPPHRTLTQIARYVRKSFKGETFTVEEFDYSNVFDNYNGKKV